MRQERSHGVMSHSINPVAQVEGCTDKTLKAGFFRIVFFSSIFASLHFSRGYWVIRSYRGDLDFPMVAGQKNHVGSEAQTCLVNGGMLVASPGLLHRPHPTASMTDDLKI